MAPYPCEEATETVVPRGSVVHFLPGRSSLPGLNPDTTDRFETPYEARMGGADTMFPDYLASRPNRVRVPAAWAPALDGPADGELQVLHVNGNVFVIVGAGANITVQAGDDGMLIVDTGLESMSEKVIAALRTISPNPLRYIINTAAALDHSGGNEPLAAIGSTVPWRAANYAAGPQGAIGSDKASVISYLTVFYHMLTPPQGGQPRVESAWPDNTYSTPWKRLYFNDEPVMITHRPANTDGNSIVLFRKSDVISAGDILDLTSFPTIDIEAGGSIQQIIDGLNHLISIAVPSVSSGGGTLVVPGHGRIADHAEVVYYRDMVTIVRDRIQDMISKDMSIAQIKEARPTAGYDVLYGSQRGSWTTDMFIEAAYESLSN
jgi:cyclase